MKRLTQTITLLILAGSLVGCSCKPTVVERPPLPLVARPHLPEITNQENKNLKNWNLAIYKKIITRELRLKFHIRTLEAVIRSTHSDE